MGLGVWGSAILAASVAAPRADGPSSEYFGGVFRGHGSAARALTLLNLSYPGLGLVRDRAAAGDVDGAMDALLAHYRNRTAAWTVVSHTFTWMRSVELADEAARNVVSRLGGAAHGRRLDFGPAGINWTHNPFWVDGAGDAEWAWGLNRQPFWLSLAWAYQNSADERYAAAWKEQFVSWSLQCPRDPDYDCDWGQVYAPRESPGTPGKRVVLQRKVWPNPRHPELTWAWRRVDAGRRALHLPELLRAFIMSRHFTPNLLARFINVVHEHGEFLANNPDRRFTQDNHGLFEAEGAAAVGVLFPELSSAELWRSRSFGLLREQMEVQVRPDGMHHEGILSYHLSALRIFTDTPVLAEANGRGAFPIWYWAAVHRMTRVLRVLSYPDGSTSQHGDTLEQQNIGQQIARWEAFFQGHDATAGVSKDAELEADVAPAVRLAHSGFFSVRSGPASTASMLLLRCGPSSNAHHHKDAGHFTLFAGNRELMPDSGAYTYTSIKEADPSDPGRQYVDSTAAHNALTVDGLSAHLPSQRQGPYQRSLGYDDCGTLLWRPPTSDGSGEDAVLVVESRHTYREPGLSHRRAVVQFPGGVFVVVDHAIGPRSGLVEAHYHMAPGSLPQRLDQGSAPSAATSFPNGTNLLLVAAPSRADLQLRQTTSWTSPGLGRRLDRPRLSLGTQKAGDEPSVLLVAALVPFAAAVPPRVTVEAECSPEPPAGARTSSIDCTVTVTLGSAPAVVRQYSFEPAALEMTPPPLRLAPHWETEYRPYYERFATRRAPVMRCSGPGCSILLSPASAVLHPRKRRSVIVSTKKQFLYCSIPKCGVSRWRRLTRRAEGIAAWQDANAHSPARNGLTYLADFSPAEATALANDRSYYSFVIVRNPFTRLLSAWLDKKDFPQFNLPRRFADFVRLNVTHAPGGRVNEHFRPMVDFCGIHEGFRFDAVLKLEDIDEWGPRIVRRLNLTSETSSGWNGGGFFPSDSASLLHNHGTAYLLQKYYTASIQRAVARHYATDFDMLGYLPDRLP